jgi:protein kinase C substrate 80K-H
LTSVSTHQPRPHWSKYSPGLVYQFENYLPDSVRGWVDQKLRDLRITLIENGILASPHTDGAESKAVTDAKSQLDSATRELDNDKSELTKHEEDLTKDYGPDSIFRALNGRCVSQDSGEYTYEHCFLSKTTQKSKKGGAHTGMGNFARIEIVSVDETVPADGKGLGSGDKVREWAALLERPQQEHYGHPGVRGE